MLTSILIQEPKPRCHLSMHPDYENVPYHKNIQLKCAQLF